MLRRLGMKASRSAADAATNKRHKVDNAAELR